MFSKDMNPTNTFIILNGYVETFEQRAYNSVLVVKAGRLKVLGDSVFCPATTNMVLLAQY